MSLSSWETWNYNSILRRVQEIKLNKIWLLVEVIVFYLINKIIVDSR